MTKNNKGFTLLELIIVFVILALLIFFMTLVVKVYIEKGRESVDLMNVKNACTELSMAALTKEYTAEYNGQRMFRNGDYVCEVELKQKIKNWQNKKDLSISGVSKLTQYGSNWLHIPLDEGSSSCIVTYNTSKNEIILDWAGGKVTVPHLYNFVIGRTMEVFWSKKDQKLRYVKLSDKLVYDTQNEKQTTVINQKFGLDADNGVTFQTVRKREASRYIDVDNYTYHVSVEFVDPSNKRKLGDGKPAIAANEDYAEVEITWNNRDIKIPTSGNRENTKALIQLEKRSKDGKSVRMSALEVDYLMSLYRYPEMQYQ